MKITQYFDRLNGEVQSIYARTKDAEATRVAAVHAFVCELHEFSSLIVAKDERALVHVACSQFEISALEMLFGLYRQACGSLRRSLECALGAIYFSLNKLEHYEWLKEENDINWKSLIDSDNGVLSRRLSQALCPSLLEEVLAANQEARDVYRELSQYVHGNNETWTISGVQIKYNDKLIEKYFEYFRIVSEVVALCYSARYFAEVSADVLPETPSLVSRLSHISSIRVATGGPRAN